MNGPDPTMLEAIRVMPGFAVLTAGNEPGEVVVLQVHCFDYDPVAFRKDGGLHGPGEIAREVANILRHTGIASIGVSARGRGEAIAHALTREGFDTNVFQAHPE